MSKNRYFHATKQKCAKTTTNRPTLENPKHSILFRSIHIIWRECVWLKLDPSHKYFLRSFFIITMSPFSLSLVTRNFPRTTGERVGVWGERKAREKWQLIFIYAHLCVDEKYMYN
jgi:hypothetical protein